MDQQVLSTRGFTVVELMVVFSIMGFLILIAIPQFTKLQGQLSSSEALQQFAGDFAKLRSQAIRKRTDIKISFHTGSYEWDIGDDGSIDGTRTLVDSSSWSGGVPSDIIINGLGLARGITGERTVSISTNRYVLSLTINQNGQITL